MLFAAYNAREWSKLRSLITDDFVYVDHRPVGWGTVVGGDEYVDLIRRGTEIVGDRRIRWIWMRAAPPRQVLGDHIVGTDEYGSTVEWERVLVRSTRDGRLSRFEIFALEELDRALARASEV